MNKNNILLIGAGNMGNAIAKALIKNKYISPENFFITDPSKEKLDFFQKNKYSTSLCSEDFIPRAQIIIIAVKPQILRPLLSEWNKKKLFKENTILVSIAAGVKVEEIQKYSQQKKVVRVMPNTPLLVGKGVSGYFFSPHITEEEKTSMTLLIKNFGLAIHCQTEEKINSITALSGSGPAYFFQILKIMAEQAVNFGFSPQEARDITLQTMQGSGLLAEQSPLSFEKLRENVTSKGGTTEAALNFFIKKNLEGIIRGGIKTAKHKSEEL